MNLKIASANSLKRRLSVIYTEIEDLQKALELIPVDSALATLSVKAALKRAERKANEICEELSRRKEICSENV